MPVNFSENRGECPCFLFGLQSVTITVMIVFIFILGLLFGSFVNAFVWRLHEQQKTKSKKKLRELSILHGRSMCPHCGSVLAAPDLVPVLSWLALRGKCRYCKKAISWQYPLVELLTGAVFALSWTALAPTTGQGYLVAFVFYVLLVLGMSLAVYDSKWYLLPTKLVVPFNVLAGVYVIAQAWQEKNLQVAALAALAALVLYVVFRLIFEASKGRWIGYGDVRLAIGLGLLAGGVPQVFLLLFVASVLGTFVSLPTVLSRKNIQFQVPFGPFLLLGAFVVALWGQWIIDWYFAYLKI